MREIRPDTKPGDIFNAMSSSNPMDYTSNCNETEDVGSPGRWKGLSSIRNGTHHIKGLEFGYEMPLDQHNGKEKLIF